MIDIAPLRPPDRAAWEDLARGYKAFYGTPITPAELAVTWARLLAAGDILGLGARRDGGLVGIAHYLFHPTTWAGEICYLQDLFTAPEARGLGVATALIHAVAESARSRGAARLYWLTKADNRTARALYDRVARHKGFVRYDYDL